MDIHKEYNLIVCYDELISESPREWCNLSTLHFTHYEFEKYHESKFESVKDIVDNKELVSMPIYYYDNDKVVLTIEPISSVIAGYIYVEKSKLLEEKISVEDVDKHFASELSCLAKYLNGDVYYYQLESKEWVEIDGKEFSRIYIEDSCYGFYSIEDIFYNMPDVPIKKFKGALSSEVSAAYQKFSDNKSKMIK